jgi:hypothetical protein
LRDDQGLFTTAQDKNATASKNLSRKSQCVGIRDAYGLNVQQDRFNKIYRAKTPARQNPKYKPRAQIPITKSEISSDSQIFADIRR